MSRRLTGKVALVSAGASGLGASVAGSITSRGGKALFVHLDVTSMASWANAVARSAEAFGMLTTLVTNAGIFRLAASNGNRGRLGQNDWHQPDGHIPGHESHTSLRTRRVT